MPAKEPKICGRIKVQPDLPPLPADKFYAGIKKRRGPGGNLHRWRKEEREGKYAEAKQQQRRMSGGGRLRQWRELERELYEEFRQRRAIGRPIRRSWFRRVSKELFKKVYPGKETQLFKFSNGWFRGFLHTHQISLRMITNTASKLPADFSSAILEWMKFNRRNCQLRPDNLMGLGDLPSTIGRYRLANICNMDQTPLPFEYLEGQTYSKMGEKTIWAQASSTSGWDKRQGTIQLTIFADGVPRVKPLVFFRGKGIGPTIVIERRLHDSRVVVKFNTTAYANSSNMLEWLDEQLVPALSDQPSFLAIDLFAAHKTEEVLDTLRANDITVSMIPGGCTGLVQPLDVSINRPFKDILKEELDTRLDAIDQEEEEILEGGGKLTGSMIGRRRIAATWAVGEAWERFSREKVEVVRRSFRCVGLSLPIDGSADKEISIKGIDTTYLVEGLVSCHTGRELTLERDLEGLVEQEGIGEILEDEVDECCSDSDDENVFFE